MLREITTVLFVLLILSGMAFSKDALDRLAERKVEGEGCEIQLELVNQFELDGTIMEVNDSSITIKPHKSSALQFTCEIPFEYISYFKIVDHATIIGSQIIGTGIGCGLGAIGLILAASSNDDDHVPGFLLLGNVFVGLGFWIGYAEGHNKGIKEADLLLMSDIDRRELFHRLRKLSKYDTLPPNYKEYRLWVQGYHTYVYDKQLGTTETIGSLDDISYTRDFYELVATKFSVGGGCEINPKSTSERKQIHDYLKEYGFMNDRPEPHKKYPTGKINQYHIYMDIEYQYSPDLAIGFSFRSRTKADYTGFKNNEDPEPDLYLDINLISHSFYSYFLIDFSKGYECSEYSRSYFKLGIGANFNFIEISRKLYTEMDQSGKREETSGITMGGVMLGAWRLYVSHHISLDTRIYYQLTTDISMRSQTWELEGRSYSLGSKGINQSQMGVKIGLSINM